MSHECTVFFLFVWQTATDRATVLLCVFRQVVKEILSSWEYHTTRQAIKHVLILNEARHRYTLFLNLPLPSRSVCFSVSVISVVFIFSSYAAQTCVWTSQSNDEFDDILYVLLFLFSRKAVNRLFTKIPS